VIGSAGFGFEFDRSSGRHVAIPQIGRVVLESDVSVGANTTIDRARIGDTVIGAGTKIDNQVHIAHNCRIGKHCILCAQVGIAGSTVIGDYVVMGGQVGIADHVEIGKASQIGAGSAVIGDLEAGSKVLSAIPAMDFKLAMKVAALNKRLPEFLKRLQNLESHPSVRV
jgi:UDP-3-O-[3-hydroxymyristoyl] glucosamine N-acyltransferase